MEVGVKVRWNLTETESRGELVPQRLRRSTKEARDGEASGVLLKLNEIEVAHKEGEIDREAIPDGIDDLIHGGDLLGHYGVLGFSSVEVDIEELIGETATRRITWKVSAELDSTLQ
jgi:hypothetical protein